MTHAEYRAGALRDAVNAARRVLIVDYGMAVTTAEVIDLIATLAINLHIETGSPIPAIIAMARARCARAVDV